MTKWVAGSGVGVVLIGMFMAASFTALTPPKNASASGCGGTVSALGLDPEQKTNAAIIIGVVQKRGLPQRAAVIAITTAITESTLHNVNHGDTAGPDSRGLFQQRDSWGPLAVRMDPAGATGLFLDALVKVANWQAIPVELAAQTVQKSSYSDGSNYKPHILDATGIVSSFQPTATCTQSAGGGIVGALPKGPIDAPGVVISRGLPLQPLFPGVPAGGFPDPYPWGECTWFAAWEHHVPGWPGRGNGGQWYSSAIADGIAVSNVPTPGSVVSYRAGSRYSIYGHVAVVIAVPGDGTMVVEESNYIGHGVLDQRVDPLNDPDIQGFVVGSI